MSSTQSTYNSSNSSYISTFDLDYYIKNESGFLDIHNNKMIMDLKMIPEYITITYNKSYLDKLSFDHYSTHNLWWVIAIYNSIINPFDLDELVNIRIPDYQLVYSVLSKHYNSMMTS
jgi:hypothetical protein